MTVHSLARWPSGNELSVTCPRRATLELSAGPRLGRQVHRRASGPGGRCCTRDPPDCRPGGNLALRDVAALRSWSWIARGWASILVTPFSALRALRRLATLRQLVVLVAVTDGINRLFANDLFPASHGLHVLGLAAVERLPRSRFFMPRHGLCRRPAPADARRGYSRRTPDLPCMMMSPDRSGARQCTNRRRRHDRQRSLGMPRRRHPMPQLMPSADEACLATNRRMRQRPFAGVVQEGQAAAHPGSVPSAPRRRIRHGRHRRRCRAASHQAPRQRSLISLAIPPSKRGDPGS